MKISPTKAALGAIACALAASAWLPAAGQDTPESLLPPGFDDPVAPAPTPSPAARRGGTTPAPSAAPAPSTGDTGAGAEAPSTGAAVGNQSGAADVEGEGDAEYTALLARYELPDYAKRSLDQVGANDLTGDTLAPDAFGRANARYLQTLMRRMEAPIASRWASIALRRALMAPINTPPGGNGADFAAERAWLLLRMGETVAARGVVQAVDVDNYTPKLFQVAMQVALATAEPAALCPLTDRGSSAAPMIGWEMAKAMCAGLAGQPNRAGELMDAARRRRAGIDSLLAERIMGTGAQSAGSVTIQWDGVNQLTAWRWGLATAAGIQVPTALYGTVGPQVRYWQATAPRVPDLERLSAAELAAAQGVFSNAGLVELYSAIDANDEGSAAAAGVGRDLRNAYVEGNPEPRLAAFRSIWDSASNPRIGYARLVLTARAAARVPAEGDYLTEADRLVASMVSAGFDIAAARWRNAVTRGSQAWALIALTDPRPRAQVSYNDADSFRATTGERRKAQMFAAGLAGLGRMSEADAERLLQALDVRVGDSNVWTRAIATAAERNQPGTVVVLAGTAMQTRNWAGVQPAALFHICAALRRVGLENYARMIAAEAVTRA